MSQENVEALRGNFDRFARGDFAELAHLTDDFELVTSPEMPDAGTYRGEAARDWLNAWVESFDGLTLGATEFIDAGDKVVVEFLQRGTPRGGSTPVELRTWSVNTRREGVLARIELFQSRGEALEAAGLS